MLQGVLVGSSCSSHSLLLHLRMYTCCLSSLCGCRRRGCCRIPTSIVVAWRQRAILLQRLLAACWLALHCHGCQPSVGQKCLGGPAGDGTCLLQPYLQKSKRAMKNRWHMCNLQLRHVSFQTLQASRRTPRIPKTSTLCRAAAFGIEIIGLQQARRCQQVCNGMY